MNFLFPFDASGGAGNKINSILQVQENKNISIIVGAGGKGVYLSSTGTGTAGPGGYSQFDTTKSEGGLGDAIVKDGAHTTAKSGANAGNGEGGAGGEKSNSGANGWVKIAYGQGIE